MVELHICLTLIRASARTRRRFHRRQVVEGDVVSFRNQHNNHVHNANENHILRVSVAPSPPPRASSFAASADAPKSLPFLTYPHGFPSVALAFVVLEDNVSTTPTTATTTISVTQSNMQTYGNTFGLHGHDAPRWCCSPPLMMHSR